MEVARRHPLAAYFVLAFAITWLLVAPLVAQGVGLISGVPPGWHALGAMGPMTAAFVVAGMEGGGAGARDILTRLTRWRVGAGWFLVAVFSPFLLFALSAVLVRVLGGSWPDLTRTGFGEIVGFSFLAGLLYGVGEETGWRGFVLPRLQRRRGALSATVVLTGFWALWHVPFFFYRFEFGAAQVVGFFVGLLAGAVWLTCLYNSTGGSILMVAAWHTTWNFVNQTAMTASVEVLSTMSVLVMVVAVAVVVLFGPATLSPDARQAAPLPTQPRRA